MEYTRLYADDHGESHFEDIEIDLTLTEYAPPAPPLELSGITAANQFCSCGRRPAGRAIGILPLRPVFSLC